VLATLQSSENDLDQLVVQVLNGGVPRCGGLNHTIALSTGLVNKVFHNSLGQQGPQDPCSFFIDACAVPGRISAMFSAPVVEMLRCAECNAVVGTTQRFAHNHVMMLYYDSTSSAPKKILELYYENIVSDIIVGYRPEAHTMPASGDACANTVGAKKIRYYANTLPRLLCLALPSRISSVFDRAHQSVRIRKNSRTIDIEARISFPEIWHSETGGHDEIQTVRYDLYATIVHHGFGPDHGHYTAYLRIDQQWFHAVRVARPALPLCCLVLWRKRGVVCFRGTSTERRAWGPRHRRHHTLPRTRAHTLTFVHTRPG
jgi:hypothetical protein